MGEQEGILFFLLARDQLKMDRCLFKQQLLPLEATIRFLKWKIGKLSLFLQSFSSDLIKRENDCEKYRRIWARKRNSGKLGVCDKIDLQSCLNYLTIFSQNDFVLNHGSANFPRLASFTLSKFVYFTCLFPSAVLRVFSYVTNIKCQI